MGSEGKNKRYYQIYISQNNTMQIDGQKNRNKMEVILSKIEISRKDKMCKITRFYKNKKKV